MKRLLPILILLLTSMIACTPTDGPDDPKNENPNPGELTAKSNSVFMSAQLDGQDWEAEFVQTLQSQGTDSKGAYTIFTLIGREGEENSDPLLSIGLTSYVDGDFKAASYNVKELWINQSEDYSGNLFYDAGSVLYNLDLNDAETSASFSISNISGNKISGTFQMKLKAFDGTYLEFTNGTFESDNYID